MSKLVAVAIGCSIGDLIMSRIGGTETSLFGIWTLVFAMWVIGLIERRWQFPR